MLKLGRGAAGRRVNTYQGGG